MTTSIPAYLDLCECCRKAQHTNWTECAPYIWINPETGAKIERRGVLLCCSCYTEFKEHRRWHRNVR